MTEPEIDDYVRHLWTHLPPEYRHLTEEQVRAVLDAETEYFERRFGPIHGWRALLGALFGRRDPAPDVIEQAVPEFERHAVAALAGRGDLTPDEIRAVMRVEGEAGPRWTPPKE